MKHALIVLMMGISLPFSCIHPLTINRLTPSELIEAEEAIFTETALLQDMVFHIELLGLSNLSSLQCTGEERTAHTLFLENCQLLRGAIKLYLDALRELGTLLGPLEQKSNLKETAAHSRNKLVEMLLKIKRLAKEFWSFPEITPHALDNLALQTYHIAELSNEEKISARECIDACEQQRCVHKKLVAHARAYERTVKHYQDERKKNYVSLQALSNKPFTDDFPDTDIIWILDHVALREWVKATIEPLYTKGSNLQLIIQSIKGSDGNVSRDERFYQSAKDLTRAERDVYASKDLFEREGAELLKLLAETQQKIGECQRACTNGATSQLCHLYKHLIPLKDYKISVLSLRDALISTVTKILIFLIDADHNRLKLYTETLKRALACLAHSENR